MTAEKKLFIFGTIPNHQYQNKQTGGGAKDKVFYDQTYYWHRSKEKIIVDKSLKILAILQMILYFCPVV